ncbi:MAG TPA: PEP-CTERM sorting domain-containing protein [Verrucomicrobiae bacterium]|nr:PEP-CTERM sorting domain-containing protein [Verrucomicrobiae bacterium]
MKGQTAIVSTCFLFELICLPTCVNLVAVMDAGAEPGRNGLYARYDLTESNSCAEWQAGFACYPAGQESFFNLIAECAGNDTNLNRGFFLSGDNHSDDLFMFIKHAITGLKPSSEYAVEASVEFLSKAPTNCIGIGGDPSASVYVKFGASGVEPVPVAQSNGYVRMNVDIGNQSNSGTNAVVIGNIATSSTDCFNTQYQLKELGTVQPLITRSDTNGALWIFTGTDSGFEGRSSLYFTQVRVHVHHAESADKKNISGNNNADTTD